MRRAAQHGGVAHDRGGHGDLLGGGGHHRRVRRRLQVAAEAAVDAVGVVVPESRALVVVNDEPTGQQLNVRVLDGALGRSAALLPVRERPT